MYLGFYMNEMSAPRIKTRGLPRLYACVEFCLFIYVLPLPNDLKPCLEIHSTVCYVIVIL